MEILDIVDSQDNVIWQKERKECYKCRSTNRLVWVVVFNDAWEILLQKRSDKCSFLPWCWALSAWGHVASWENYLDAAKRELFEEVWIKAELEFVWKIYNDRLKINWKLNNTNKSHFYFQSIYKCIYNWKLDFSDWEVSEAGFFSMVELKEMIKNGDKIMPWTVEVLENFFLK